MKISHLLGILIIFIFHLIFFVFKAFAGEQACYQSVVSHGGQLIVLGTESVTVFSLRSWIEVSTFLFCTFKNKKKIKEFELSPDLENHSGTECWWREILYNILQGNEIFPNGAYLFSTLRCDWLYKKIT